MRKRASVSQDVDIEQPAEQETRFITHRNALLVVLGRQCAVATSPRARSSHLTCRRGVAHRSVRADEVDDRYRAGGVDALIDHSSAPAHRPTRLPLDAIGLIDSWRRERKWSARRIAHALHESHAISRCLRTVTRVVGCTGDFGPHHVSPSR